MALGGWSYPLDSRSLGCFFVSDFQVPIYLDLPTGGAKWMSLKEVPLMKQTPNGLKHHPVGRCCMFNKNITLVLSILFLQNIFSTSAKKQVTLTWICLFGDWKKNIFSKWFN